MMSCSHRYADLLISYFRDIASDMLAKSMAMRAMRELGGGEGGRPDQGASAAELAREWGWRHVIVQPPGVKKCWAGDLEGGVNCTLRGGLGGASQGGGRRGT